MNPQFVMWLLFSLGVPVLMSCEARLEPRSILKRALAAHGGEANIMKPRRGVIKSFSPKESIGDTRLVETFDLPKQWKRVTVDVLRGKKTVLTQLMVDGQQWEWVDGGSVQKPKFGATTKAQFTAASVLLDIMDEKVRLSSLNTIKVANRPAAGVRAVWKHGAADYYFDQETGLLVQSNSKVKSLAGDELDVKSVFTDYKKTDGVQLSHRNAMYFKGGGFDDYILVGEMIISEIKIGDKLPEDTFSLPQ